MSETPGHKQGAMAALTCPSARPGSARWTPAGWWAHAPRCIPGPRPSPTSPALHPRSAGDEKRAPGGRVRSVWKNSSCTDAPSSGPRTTLRTRLSFRDTDQDSRSRGRHQLSAGPHTGQALRQVRVKVTQQRGPRRPPPLNNTECGHHASGLTRSHQSPQRKHNCLLFLRAVMN